jgi:hypothetical protein
MYLGNQNVEEMVLEAEGQGDQMHLLKIAQNVGSLTRFLSKFNT